MQCLSKCKQRAVIHLVCFFFIFTPLLVHSLDSYPPKFSLFMNLFWSSEEFGLWTLMPKVTLILPLAKHILETTNIPQGHKIFVPSSLALSLLPTKPATNMVTKKKKRADSTDPREVLHFPPSHELSIWPPPQKAILLFHVPWKPISWLHFRM